VVVTWSTGVVHAGVREESKPSIQLLSLFSLFVRHESLLCV
jgi:hypothetical protein